MRAAVALDVPEELITDDALIAHLQAILDNSVRPGSGGFFAYISGGGTVPGAIADLLASGLNANVGGWVLSPAATEIEAQLLRWLADQFGLPAGAGGHFASGGSLANLSALKLARDRADTTARTAGVGRRPLAIYASEETHFTIDRAADVLGLGESAVRKVAVDDRLAMRVDDLERLLTADLAAGVRPAAIVATAGTTGTAAIDPIDALADVAARVGAWLHVDAAYGGAVVLSDALRPLGQGIDRADSITFDAHKWLYAPAVCAAFLVRDASLLQGSFSAHAAYVAQDRDVADRGVDYGFEGLQLSRGFIALRYRPDGVDDDAYLDRLNDRVMTELQLDGRVFPSNAVVHGRSAIRTCIVSYRTEAKHLQQLLDLTREIGERVHASGIVS